MTRRKLRLGACRECQQMVVVAVTASGISPYYDECTGCGSPLDEESVARTGAAADV